MGRIHTRIRLSNPRESALAPLEIAALVDTGAITLCVPEHVAIRLNLETLEQREVTTDGQRRRCDYVGPVKAQFGNRSCFSAALVLGDRVVGAIPMEDMDLIVHSASRSLTVNPESPNIPSVIAKGGVKYDSSA